MAADHDAMEPSAPAPPRRRGGGLIGIAARAALSIAALVVLFRLVDPAKLNSVFARADAGLLAAAFAVLSAVPALMALRWQAACRAQGGALPFAAHWRMTYIGSFLGQALPTSVGVEAVRGWLHARESGSISLAAAGVVADRLSGVLALLFLVVGASPFQGTVISEPRGLALARAMTAASLGGLGVFALLASPAGARAAAMIPFAPLRRFAANVHRAVAGPLTLFRLVAISCVNFAVTLLGLYLISLAFGAAIPPLALLVLTPLAFAMLLLPISVAGWGLREGGFVFFLGLAGVAPEQALALSLSFGAIMLLVSLPGAPLFLAARRRGEPGSGGGGRVEG